MAGEFTRLSAADDAALVTIHDPEADDVGATWGEIDLVVFDFDGVFTDNTVVVDQHGNESVTCWRGDGIGLSALADIGVDTFVLSKEQNPVVAVRCNKLGVACEHGIDDKVTYLTNLLAERGLDASRVAYVGNDINDAECLAIVGLPIVVADAHDDVRVLARYTTWAPGGRGAVREVCDHIVAAHHAQAHVDPDADA